MNDLLRATAIGALSGSRSMLGPTVVARRALPGAGARLMPLLAAGEMLADKSARIPARTTRLPLAGRILSGAFAARAQARSGHRAAAALAGAAGAVAGTYAFYHLRRLATSRGVSNTTAGLIEDALAVAAGLWLARTAVSAIRPRDASVPE